MADLLPETGFLYSELQNGLDAMKLGAHQTGKIGTHYRWVCLVIVLLIIVSAIVIYYYVIP